MCKNIKNLIGCTVVLFCFFITFLKLVKIRESEWYQKVVNCEKEQNFKDNTA